MSLFSELDALTPEQLDERIEQCRRSQARLEAVIPRLKKLAAKERRKKLIQKAKEQLDDLNKTIKQLKELDDDKG